MLLRAEGRLVEAVAMLEAALAEARRAPLDVPFQDRVQLGLALADCYLANGRPARAQAELIAEAAFAEQIFQLTRRTGTPAQVRAASAGRFQVRDRVTQVALLGQPAPEIEVVDWVLGTPTTLAEQRGQVVLLEFWASWCRPCLAMFPRLVELDARYADRGLTILALTRYSGPAADLAAQRTSERATIAQTVADRGIGFAVGIAPDVKLQQRYGAMGIPGLALVDRQGTVRYASSSGDEAELERVMVGLLADPHDAASVEPGL
jgi:thiol-disulfide isomerase/thioredoxin